MFSHFFIDRPVFSCVISIVVVLAGLIAIPALPVEQTPDITPPTVAVTTTYPGASAEVLAETVAIPIESEVNGVEDMIYMSSKSSDDGTYELIVTFEVGTDIDMATVLVQNRVAIATPKLPEEVKREGVKTEKQSTNIVLMVNMISPDGRYSELELSNFVATKVKDELARIPGVGKVNVMGAKDLGMRIWLDPEKLKARGITVTEVMNAIREQNVQVAAGQIGAEPSPDGQNFQYTINTLGRLTDAAQFRDMILRVGQQGRILRVGDVARVEEGAQSYRWEVELNGAPSVAVAIYQLPGANSLQVADNVRAKMEELKPQFLDGMDYRIAYDTTRFVTASIDEVKETLLIAVALVIFTVYVFLQDFRTTLIPSLTIPVSLIGTFAVMLALGFSINTLSLFGLVLAIGIVVDDAIVVVENTMRLIDEEQLKPKDAAKKAMSQVAGPVVATTLVLLAVFVPTAFMGGITGRLYNQFSVTIAVATVFSSVNALTLAPALCGMLLRPSPEKRALPFRLFNSAFDTSTRGYMGVVKRLLRLSVVTLVLSVAGVGLMVFGFIKVPGGFIPDEDQGYFIAVTRLPDGASMQRTRTVLEQMDEILEDAEGVADIIKVNGYNALDTLVTSNSGTYFVVMKPWEERAAHVQDTVAEVSTKFAKIQEGMCFAFLPPPIQGLGSGSGFEFQLRDVGNAGSAQLQDIANDLVFTAGQVDMLTRLNNNFSASVPQLYLDVNREKAKRMGIPLQEVFGTLQAFLGSAYVNDFNKYDRTWKVQIQADEDFRNTTDSIQQLEVRDQAGNMIPLHTLLTVREIAGPQVVYRFNSQPSATITGQARPGFSSGQAIASMAAVADQNLPQTMNYGWSGVSYQELNTGSQLFIFGLSAVFVYLFLAAQYESWPIPLAVLMTVPFAILGGIGLTAARRYDNNVYTQIGFVLLIGLSTKTAILIVEFAKQLREEGKSILEASETAARLRFRAILMTAFSFILGVIPLLIASGAGAGSRRALGTAVFGGMLAATVFGVFMIPSFYLIVQRVTEWAMGPPKNATAAEEPGSD